MSQIAYKKSFLAGLVIGLLSITLFCSYAMAQNASNSFYQKPLTDGDINKMIPLLRIEMAGNNNQDQIRNQNMQEHQAWQEATQNLMNQIRSGNVDPLTWLKAHSKYVFVPSNVKYSSAGSQQLSASDQMPSAVFTYGLDAKAIDKLLMSGNQTASLNAITNPKRMPHSQNDAKVYAAASSFKSFYSTRKFNNLGTIDSITYESPDKSIKASFLWFNLFKSFNGPNAFQTLPLGPILIVQAENIKPKFTEKFYQPVDFESALKKAQISKDKYYDLKTQLLQASADAKDPESLKSITNYQNSISENNDVINGIQQSARIRETNAELYKRYASELDQLLNY